MSTTTTEEETNLTELSKEMAIASNNKERNKSWMEEYVDTLSDDICFDIVTLRYLEKRTPIAIAKYYQIPLQVVKFIISKDNISKDRE